MIDVHLPSVLKEPLVFGNSAQINAIKEIERAKERAETLCGECTGEGMIECPECEGSGEKKR